MRQLLLDLAERGKTLIVTSHILPELARICHRVAIITRGRLRAYRHAGRDRPPAQPAADDGGAARPGPTASTGPRRSSARHVEPGAEVTASPAELAVRFRTAKARRSWPACWPPWSAAGARRDAVPRGADRPGGGVHDRGAGRRHGRFAAGEAMNPIIRRELLELLRTRKAVAVQVGLALACAPARPGPLADRRRQRPDRRAVRSRCCACSATACSPASCSWCRPSRPRRSSARRSRARWPCCSTRRCPRSIYLGKLGGVLGFTAILLLMTLPAAAACYALGGSSVRGGVGLLYAVLGDGRRAARDARPVRQQPVAVDRRGPPDHLRPGAGGLRAAAGPALAGCRATPARWPDAADWLRCLSPVPAVMEVLGHGGVGAHGMDAGGGAIDRYLILATGDQLALRPRRRSPAWRVPRSTARGRPG